jgi:hypothetical protein
MHDVNINNQTIQQPTFARGKDAVGLAIQERIQRFWNALRQSVVLKII